MNKSKKQSFFNFPLGKRKAQMEIIGLTIIVILIAIGLLFAVRFIIFKQPESYKKDYVHSQMAANMLNTLLNTNTDCHDVSITELLQDAARIVKNINCDGQTSKKFVDPLIENLLNSSLGEWKKSYYFKAEVSKDIIVEKSRGNCGPDYPNVEKERKHNFIPTDAGVMSVILDICS
ncbi:MAG: hypothetical protein KAU20_02755 [Nanoarchaeota archaeon]|nr:hypothetical protein [Nanoarchaeota archaeon]